MTELVLCIKIYGKSSLGIVNFNIIPQKQL